jgi:hypothetical protein
MSETDPNIVAEQSGRQRRRVRVKRRVTPPLHLSRKRQQILAALVLAVVAASAVAWFAGSSTDNPESYVPGGAIR